MRFSIFLLIEIVIPIREVVVPFGIENTCFTPLLRLPKKNNIVSQSYNMSDRFNI